MFNELNFINAKNKSQSILLSNLDIGYSTDFGLVLEKEIWKIYFSFVNYLKIKKQIPFPIMTVIKP